MTDKTPTYEATSYSSSQVRLYGLPVHPGEGGTFNLGGLQIAAGEEGLTCCRTAEPEKPLHPALIFGYAYQGHCYHLPKPKGMLLPVGGVEIPPGDCGYSDKTDYRVWVVDKLHHGVEIEITEGEIKELVLEANLPGKRSPTTYRSTMQVAHRSGRLTE